MSRITRRNTLYAESRPKSCLVIRGPYPFTAHTIQVHIDSKNENIFSVWNQIEQFLPSFLPGQVSLTPRI